MQTTGFRLEQNNMIIDQMRVSKGAKKFKKQILNKYNFKDYYSKNKPAFFFGCSYKANDIEQILQHKSLAVIIWIGTDALWLTKKPKIYKRIINNKKIKHIAISEYIEKDLEKYNLSYYKIPIHPSDIQHIEPYEKGPNIYIYGGSPSRKKFYGLHYVKKIKENFKNINFDILYSRPPQHVPHAEIFNIYKKCFLGLRLTPHDGLPNTVLELGAMGRKCIWNGNLPNAVQWENIDDILRIISNEMQTIGSLDQELSLKTKSFVNIDESWTNTEFYT